MRTHPRRFGRDGLGKAWILALVLSFVLTMAARDAAACGVFAMPMPGDGDIAAHLPFLSVEQVLLFWDQATGTEDFVRETRFERADRAFGFVVPTPTRPEVAAVAKAPFDDLRRDFPFEAPPALMGVGGGPPGAVAAAAPPPPVVVLAQQRIGVFTAFTLATTDAGAFEAWLGKNGFAIAEAAKPWIAHYVGLQFFFVALRYDPARHDAGAGPSTGSGMTSQTVRIRFHTPNPYYPYMEPGHPPAPGLDPSRMLAGWLVTREPMKAVASILPDEGSPPTWRRPWVDGQSYALPPAELKAKLAPDLADLVPDAPLVTVQTFHDFKRSRAGYGDVVLAPATPVTLTPAEIDARRFLLPVVDPTLLTPRAAHMAMVGCAVAGGARSWPSTWAASLAWLFGLAALLARRVRRAGAAACVAALLACHATAPTNDVADGALDPLATSAVSDASAPAPPAPLVTREDHEANALAILSGRVPPGGIGYAMDEAPPIVPVRPPAAAPGSVKAKIVSGDADALEAAVLATHAHSVLCYRRGLEDDPSMEGKLRLEVTRAASGGATVKVVKNRGLSAAVAECCSRSLERTVDDLPGRAGRAVLELAFKPTAE
ncbi:MAG TPA: DUF2330 domain-containing protein [Polyangiaceae bacterium]|jgi:hypothetical protein|nr:DUF2330 domain-containing protein [Polyangiaceae bacterium]